MAKVQIIRDCDIRENGTFYVCRLLSFDQAEINLSCCLRLFVKGDMGTFAYGDILRLFCTIKEPECARNPGNFDYKQYLLTLNIGATASISSASEVEWMKCEWPSRVTALGIQCRKAMLHVIRRYLPNEGSYLLEAVFLGSKDYFGEKAEQIFSEAGISHFMAVSGAHAAFFLLPFTMIFRKIGVKKQHRYMAEIGLLFSYAAVTGFGFPIVRASIMMSLKRFAFLVRRDYDPVIALLWAAIFLMVQNPHVIYSVSMQLSFGAVLSIVWIQPVLKRWVMRRRIAEYVPQNIIQNICLCLSVQLGILPILINQFQMPSVFIFPANLFCAPLIELMMMAGIAMTALGLLQIPLIGQLLGYMGYFLGEAVLQIADFFAWLGSFQPCLLTYLSGWQILLYYILLVCILWLPGKGWKQFGAGGLCLLLLCGTVIWPTSWMKLVCIDVGQGESIFLRTPSGKNYLMDCGSSTVSQVGRYRILPYLKTEKVRELECLILSHYDSDHISGVQELFSAYRIRYLLLPDADWDVEAKEQIAALASTYHTEIRYWQQGDSLLDGEVTITCLHPYQGQTVRDDNSISMVLRISYGGFQALLTGDLPEAEEETILKWTKACDVLKVAHHGSASSTGMEFLQAVQPKIALISCGVDNRYGHPQEELLRRLEETGSKIFITAEDGAVTVKTNGENIVVTKFL